MKYEFKSIENHEWDKLFAVMEAEKGVNPFAKKDDKKEDKKDDKKEDKKEDKKGEEKPAPKKESSTQPKFDPKADAKKLAETMKIPVPPKAAIKVKVDEIYNLGKSGQKVA